MSGPAGPEQPAYCSRRDFLKYLAFSALATLAGCNGNHQTMPGLASEEETRTGLSARQRINELWRSFSADCPSEGTHDVISQGIETTEQFLAELTGYISRTPADIRSESDDLVPLLLKEDKGAGEAIAGKGAGSEDSPVNQEEVLGASAYTAYGWARRGALHLKMAALTNLDEYKQEAGRDFRAAYVISTLALAGYGERVAEFALTEPDTENPIILAVQTHAYTRYLDRCLSLFPAESPEASPEPRLDQLADILQNANSRPLTESLTSLANGSDAAEILKRNGRDINQLILEAAWGFTDHSDGRVSVGKDMAGEELLYTKQEILAALIYQGGAPFAPVLTSLLFQEASTTGRDNPIASLRVRTGNPAPVYVFGGNNDLIKADYLPPAVVLPLLADSRGQFESMTVGGRSYFVIGGSEKVLIDPSTVSAAGNPDMFIRKAQGPLMTVLRWYYFPRYPSFGGKLKPSTLGGGLSADLANKSLSQYPTTLMEFGIGLFPHYVPTSGPNPYSAEFQTGWKLDYGFYLGNFVKLKQDYEKLGQWLLHGFRLPRGF